MTRLLSKKETSNLVKILEECKTASFKIERTDETIVVTWNNQQVFRALEKDRYTWIVWHRDDLFAPVS